MAWCVWEDPDDLSTAIYAMWGRQKGSKRRLYRLESDGTIHEIYAPLPALSQPEHSAVDQLASLADDPVGLNEKLNTCLTYKGKIYARAQRGVYSMDPQDGMASFTRVAELPEGLVLLRGGGLGILEDPVA